MKNFKIVQLYNKAVNKPISVTITTIKLINQKKSLISLKCARIYTRFTVTIP